MVRVSLKIDVLIGLNVPRLNISKIGEPNLSSNKNKKPNSVGLFNLL
jgi:hypothetical protein